MSQHPSLRSSDKDKQHRSVLKRYERLKILKDKEKWKDGDSVFGLQKVKIIKFKIKKEKAAPAEGAEAIGAEPGAVPGATAAGATPAKAAPQARPAAKEAARPQIPPGAEGKKEKK